MEQERRRAEYKRKMEYIFNAIENWKQAQLHLEFCNALKNSCKNVILTDEQRNNIQEMINMLESHTQKMNPLNSLFDFIEDFKSRYTWLNVPLIFCGRMD